VLFGTLAGLREATLRLPGFLATVFMTTIGLNVPLPKDYVNGGITDDLVPPAVLPLVAPTVLPPVFFFQ
jgi:hypothetical protein